MVFAHGGKGGIGGGNGDLSVFFDLFLCSFFVLRPKFFKVLRVKMRRSFVFLLLYASPHGGRCFESGILVTEPLGRPAVKRGAGRWRRAFFL